MELIAIAFLILVMIFLAFGVKIVPQSQNYLVERLGRYNRTLDAGLQIIIPIFEAIRHKVDVLERQLPTNRISAITLDNVTIELRLAILYRIVEAEKAIYRIYDLDQAIQTTVTGVVRSVIGRTELDGVQSREDINSMDRLDVKFSVGAIEVFARDSERNCKFLGSEEDCRFVEAIKKEMKPLGSGLTDQSQKSTVAANASAEK